MKNKVIYWLPRIIAVVFAAAPILIATIDSFRLGFSLAPYLMFAGLSLIGGLLAFVAWKWPKIGGVFFTLLGAFVIVMASNTSIGVDWGGVLTGGIPMAIAGILFLFQGFKKSS